MIMKAVYQMVTFDFKHVQTLHTISQLPISVMSRDKELVQLYGNEDYLLPYYQFLKHLAIPYNQDITVYEGLFEESFLIFPVCQYLIAIGPFYPYSPDINRQEQLSSRFLEQFSHRSKKEILSYIKLVPCFPTTSIRSLLVSIDAFFQTQFEASYQQAINHLLEESEQIVADSDIVLHLKHTKKNSFQLPTVLNHLNHIIDLVKLGNTQLLKQEINRLPSSSVTSSSIPALRAEKNLTVVYLTKLLELSFEENTDVAKSYALVKHYMTLNEEAPDLIDVSRIRCAALIDFSESLTNKSISDKQQMYNSILHYVDNHLYSKLKVSDIANYLNISGSHLRSVFKKYSDISLQSYILKAKIKEGQLLLQRGVPVGEVAKLLHFYDTTHFLKTFKQYVGISSNEYLTKYRESSSQ